MWIWAAQGGVTNTSTLPRLSSFYITQTRACMFNNINVLAHLYRWAKWQKHFWVRDHSLSVCVSCPLQIRCYRFYPPKVEGRDRIKRKRPPTYWRSLFTPIQHISHRYDPAHLHPPHTYKSIFPVRFCKKKKTRLAKTFLQSIMLNRSPTGILIEPHSKWRPAQLFLMTLSKKNEWNECKIHLLSQRKQSKNLIVSKSSQAVHGCFFT